jgi:hypothetical protein
MVGPFQIVNDPPADFRLLPVHYSVDLAVPLPYVQASFYAVSFLPHGINLTQAKLSLRLFGAAAIEAIPPLAEDFPIDAKYAPIVVFRRNLTDSEIRNLPWRAGQETGSFELSAKATDGEKTFTYGPVSSMVIEGWVKMPTPTPDIQRPVVPKDFELEAGFISLRDAATRVYEELKHPSHIWTILAESHAQGDAVAILDQTAAFIVSKIALYGRQPPSTKIERLAVNEQTQVAFDGGAATMRYLRFRKPPCTDLRVKLAEVENLIERERGNYTPSRRG